MLGTSIALSGVLSGDRITGSGIGTFSTQHAGNGLSYSLNGLTLTGADAPDYYLSNGLTAVGNNGTITPLALTVSGSSVSPKTYDGTTAATITGGVLNGVLTGDQAYVSLATQAGSFASKNAGIGIGVTAADTLVLASPVAGDYTLIEPTGLTGTIAPLALTVSGSAVTPKIYDGTTAATITGGVLNGVLTGDQAYVSLVTQAGSFASKNAGIGIGVTAADTLALTGPAAGDYTLTEPTGLTGTITPRSVMLNNETAASKTYDGTTAAAVSGGPLSNMVAGDALALIGTFASPNAGQQVPVTVALSGADAGNYVLGGATTLAANINPAPLLATANSIATPLGNQLPTLSGTFSGFVGGQTLAVLQAAGYQASWSSSVTNVSAAGHYPITGSFTDGNYSVVQAAGNATAFDATLSASSIGQSSGSVLYSLTSLLGASGTTASGTAGSGVGASGTVANSAGFVLGAGGAAAGSQDASHSSAGSSDTDASTGTDGGLTLAANSAYVASDGTVILGTAARGTAASGAVASSTAARVTAASGAVENGAVANGAGFGLGAGGSDTAVTESGGNAAMGSKNESPSDLGARRLIIVRGGVNASLAR
jgi:hypothetical protein